VRVVTLLLAAVATVLAIPKTALAGNGEGLGTSASSDAATGTVAATAGRETVGGLGTSNASVSRPRCSWEVYTDLQAALSDPQPGPLAPIRREGDGSFMPTGSGPTRTSSTLYKRTCGDVAGFTLGWVADFVDVDALISSARQSVTAQVPTPSMNVNPDPSVGGTVNLGLWLAVDDPGQVSITASVGPVWATVTARYVSTLWDFGNGDSVECEGLGTPIVDTDTVEQGPCGYTYRETSAPQFTGTDDLAYHASVTGRWIVTYATSAGESGTLSPINRTTPFTYQVRQIQTLRVADDG
jgi:hypothetical protein